MYKLKAIFKCSECNSEVEFEWGKVPSLSEPKICEKCGNKCEEYALEKEIDLQVLKKMYDEGYRVICRRVLVTNIPEFDLEKQQYVDLLETSKFAKKLLYKSNGWFVEYYVIDNDGSNRRTPLSVGNDLINLVGMWGKIVKK